MTEETYGLQQHKIHLRDVLATTTMSEERKTARIVPAAMSIALFSEVQSSTRTVARLNVSWESI